MSKRNLNKKILSGVMAAWMLTSTAPFSVMAAEAPTQILQTEIFSTSFSLSSVDSALNFSYANAKAEETISASSLIFNAAGEIISGEEAAYLASQGIELVYDAGLSANLVSASVSGSTLTVNASEKSYRAYNGATVTWLPISVTIGETEKKLEKSSKGYSATFTDLSEDELYTATFSYQTTVTVSASEVASVLNRAYDDALDAIAAEELYEEAKVAYEAAVLKYQDACKEYEKLFEEYQKYELDQILYDRLLSDYNAYMKRVKAYEDAVKAYEQYKIDMAAYEKAYAQYELDMEAFPDQQAKYEEYLDYLSRFDAVIQKLEALDSAFIADSAGRTMYGTLNGGTVATVLARKDELIKYGGADPNDINNAGVATTNLQMLLDDYSSCSTDEECIRWYKKNYETLKSNFIFLYSSLHNLGQNTLVKSVLNAEGKMDRYCQFVGQLYVISTGLDDSAMLNSSWTYNGRSLTDLIDSAQLVSDSNSASPADVELPPPMEPVDKPKVPTAPKKPTEVSEPVITWTSEVEHPGEGPDEVAKPKKPELEDYTGEPLRAPEIAPELQAVITLVKANQLGERSTANIKDVTLEANSTFDKAVSLSDKPIATFYDHSGKNILYAVQVIQGSAVSYAGVTPSREADAQYTYAFSGWVDANGNPANMSVINANTAFYADYSKTLNSYTVTWVAAGKTVTETYLYGELPSYSGELSYRDAYSEYTFTGWSSTIRPVTGEIVYTAQYAVRSLSDTMYAVTFNVRGQRYYRTFAYGTMPVFDSFEKDYVSGGYRYVFKGWSPEIVTVSGDAEYTALFEQTWLIPAGENGESSAHLEITKNTYTVTTAESVVNAAYAVEEALNAGAQLVLQLGNASITLTNETLQELSNAAYFRLKPSKTSASAVYDAGNALSWAFEITDEQGNPLTFASEILVEVALPEETENGGRLNAYVGGNATRVSVQNQNAYLRTTSTGLIEIRPYYTVEIISDENGDIVPEKETAEAGASVKLNTYLEQGWGIDKLTISVNGGAETELVLVDGAFVMPDGDVTIRATFCAVEYTVVFVANGVELARTTYGYGENVTVPDMSNHSIIEIDGETYTFAGWDTIVSSVTKDVVYTAKYEPGSADDAYRSPYNSNKLFTIVLPIVLGVVAVAVGLLVFFRIRKKKYGIDFKTDVKNISSKVVGFFRKVGKFFRDIDWKGVWKSFVSVFRKLLNVFRKKK